MTKLYMIMHNAIENGALAASWAEKRGVELCRVRLYEGAELPELHLVRGIVVLGGAMGIYDEALYPWLRLEKNWLTKAVASNLPILGICLGAQLLCAALGGRVESGAAREIGFTDISRVKRNADSSLLGELPEVFRAFQWHSDRCVLPPEVELLAVSEFCSVQAFARGSRILGIQFHLDYDPRLVRYNLEHFSAGLESVEGYVQSRDRILSELAQLQRTAEYLELLLDRVFL